MLKVSTSVFMSGTAMIKKTFAQYDVYYISAFHRLKTESTLSSITMNNIPLAPLASRHFGKLKNHILLFCF
jgi:hypothetical protein